MESIKDKVAIVGMGCTKFGELWDKGPEDLMVEACYEAFEDAGLGPEDMQGGVVCQSCFGMHWISVGGRPKNSTIFLLRV